MSGEKVIVGVDFSPESDAAVHQALAVARNRGAELVLLHIGVVPDAGTGIPESLAATAASYSAVIKERLAQDRDALQQLRSRLSGQGATVSQMFLDGFPDTGIVKAAEELGASIIVVGTHGRTGIKRFLLGSVAERVVRLSSVPVLVARDRGDGSDTFHKILVPTDFSDSAERALEMAISVAPKGSTVTLFHAWQLPAFTGSYYAPIKAASEIYESVKTSVIDQVTALSAKLVNAHQTDGVTIDFVQSEGPPAKEIHTWLDEHDCDLIVTGSHGRRGVRRFLLGSVAEVTVRHAPCSVLVYHGPKAPKHAKGAAK